MQSLSRGWSFLQEAWQMAFKDRDLIKPSIYAMIAGFFVTIAGLVPLIGAALLFGESGLVGRALLVIIGAVLVFVHYVVTYIFSGMTVYLIYGYLAEGDGRMDKAWARVQREFWNIIALAGASTLVNLLTTQMRRGNNRRAGAGLIGGAIAGLIDTVWTEASYLILPAMMIEDANLGRGIKRATQMAKGNLLLIGVSAVGVRWITGAISFVLGAIGLVLGFGLGFGLITLFNSNTTGLVLGIGLGGMLFFVFVMVASAIGSYTMTAYHTCLFLWARDVEKAREQSQGAPIPVQIPAPAPLAAALMK
ncbi:MAG TPA: hypothetical protein VF784_01700 [Anaerolineales bacterium]